MNATTTLPKGTVTRERPGKASNGWSVLIPTILGWLISLAGVILGIIPVANSNSSSIEERIGLSVFIIAFILMIVMIAVSSGFFTLQPNEAKVLVLFGEYRGTVRGSGFFWANPFYGRTLSNAVAEETHQDDDEGESKTGPVKAKISLRARTLNGHKLKVNDKNGNPIEIANVVVWHIVDTAKAVFDVDHYERYVATQSETALRHVASLYAYDHNADSDETSEGQITLRSNIVEVSQSLKQELADRLEPAGIAIDDARLTHLAYAPEIAQVMLRRQQAEAIIAARTKIVQGAVSMVDMALKELENDGVVELDNERKAAMVSNLMVVLCGDNDAQPVLNTGTLYS